MLFSALSFLTSRITSTKSVCAFSISLFTSKLSFGQVEIIRSPVKPSLSCNCSVTNGIYGCQSFNRTLNEYRITSSQNFDVSFAQLYWLRTC